MNFALTISQDHHQEDKYEQAERKKYPTVKF